MSRQSNKLRGGSGHLKFALVCMSRAGKLSLPQIIVPGGVFPSYDSLNRNTNSPSL